jgi:hypothetical protein
MPAADAYNIRKATEADEHTLRRCWACARAHRAYSRTDSLPERIRKALAPFRARTGDV